MCRTILHVLILKTLSCLCWAEDAMEVTVSCPEYQRAFRGSCYEFLDLDLSFFRAQAWCEQDGGHLAFIPDKDTQCFIQRHLNPEKNMWLGMAVAVDPNPLHTPTDEGKAAEIRNKHLEATT